MTQNAPHSHKPIKIVKHHRDDAARRPQRRMPSTGQSSRSNPTAVAAVWISIGIVLVLGLFLAIHAVRQQVYRDRRIAIEMRKTKEHAEQTCNEVETCAMAIIALAEPALAHADTVNRILENITGISAPKEPVTTSAPRTLPSQTKRADTTNTKTRDDDDRDAPEGMMSREARLAQIEAERARNEARKNGATVAGLSRGSGEATSVTTGTDGTTSYARRTESREEPRIQALARKTKNLSESIERKGLAAREMESSALRFKSLALTQELYQKVKLRDKELTDLLASIRKIEKDAREESEQIEVYVSEARELEDTHKQELARIAAEREAERKAKEHAALVKKEIERARETRRFNQELIEKNEFSEALQSVSDAKARLSTDEGRAKLALLEEKYQKLVDLKAFLIKRLNADPMSFGWIQDGPPVDILGADSSGVKIRDKLTPWSSVALAQMVKLIDFYLDSEKIPVSQRAGQGFAVAIYFHEQGKPEIADVYLERATTLMPSLRGEASRLLSD